jgi:Bardet-Biedl syndrome 5 protein
MAATNNLEFIWQDREIVFDAKPQLLECRRGEVAIDSINSVEDTKGNNGERGSLIITNLRIMWISHANNKINLSKFVMNVCVWIFIDTHVTQALVSIVSPL